MRATSSLLRTRSRLAQIIGVTALVFCVAAADGGHIKKSESKASLIRVAAK
jgi:hypothetical protein